jgi:hypothetical protein
MSLLPNLMWLFVMLMNLNYVACCLQVSHRCDSTSVAVRHQKEGPETGRSAPVGRTVRASAEQIRILSFLLCLLPRISG